MAEKMPVEFSNSDVLFLLETVEPKLVSKIDIVKNDPSIIEMMLEQDTEKLFERIMLMGKDMPMTQVSPRLLFEIVLRKALKDMETQSYTVERSANQKIPVFDAREVIKFFADKAALKYLADMLASFTRTESFTRRVRVRKGIWRRLRFSDMDIDSLVRLCESVDEEHRFGLYKRIADLCLFILGMFPEYTTPFGVKPMIFGRMRRSAEDYEAEGRMFYKLAGKHKSAQILELTGVLSQLHDKFNLAKKPLNYISENLIRFQKEKLFPYLSDN